MILYTLHLESVCHILLYKRSASGGMIKLELLKHLLPS